MYIYLNIKPPRKEAGGYSIDGKLVIELASLRGGNGLQGKVRTWTCLHQSVSMLPCRGVGQSTVRLPGLESSQSR